MKEPAQRTVFAGLDGCTDAELPAWYAEQNPVDGPSSFAEAIRDLSLLAADYDDPINRLTRPASQTARQSRDAPVPDPDTFTVKPTRELPRPGTTS